MKSATHKSNQINPHGHAGTHTCASTHIAHFICSLATLDKTSENRQITEMPHRQSWQGNVPAGVATAMPPHKRQHHLNRKAGANACTCACVAHGLLVDRTPFARPQKLFKNDLELADRTLERSGLSILTFLFLRLALGFQVAGSRAGPIPGVIEGFRRKANFEKILGVTKQPTQQQSWSFLGAHGSGYMGLSATMWVPMGA